MLKSTRNVWMNLGPTARIFIACFVIYFVGRLAKKH